MDISVTGVLQVMENALVEKAVAKVKKDFASDREAKYLKVQTVLKALEAVLDEKATNKTMALAWYKAGQSTIDRGLKGVPSSSLFGQTFKGGVLGMLIGLEAFVESTFDEADYEDVVRKMGLNESSKALLNLGATIGQIFMNQPDLFV